MISTFFRGSKLIKNRYRFWTVWLVGLEEEIIDKDFRQSYWLALQFWVQPNQIFTLGVPQASHGMTWGETEIVSSEREFKLSRVRVTEGKITVNVWQKSRGNRFSFELARVRVIGSRLYFHGKIETTESLQKLPMVPPAWNRDISPLPLKPPKSFKTRTTIFVVVGLFCFVLFSFGCPEPVRGRQCEETFQKSSWSQKKNSRDSAAFYF